MTIKSPSLVLVALMAVAPMTYSAPPDPILTAVSDVSAYRTKIEECVRDLKASLPTETAQYIAARTQYIRTKHAYDLFLRGLQTATSAEGRRQALASAQQAQRSAEQFIQYQASIDQHDRGLLAAIPPFVELVAALFDLRGGPGQKNDTVDAITNQIMWKSWDRIQ